MTEQARNPRSFVNALRALLVVMVLAVAGYTVAVIGNAGWNLVAVAIADIAAMGWAGQFHVDFLTYLVLSGLWVAWRHRFSGAGIVLGLVATVGGMLFLGVYLLIASFRARGDVRALLLGDNG